MSNRDEILKQIDNQVAMLLSTRAVFPYIPKKFVGEKSFETAPFYKNQGYQIVFSFQYPLTETQIEQYSAIGRWINQNFLIRLCAILEYYEVISKKERINTKLDGHEHIDILRRLRNLLVHTSGRYNAEEAEERKLFSRIVDTYSIDQKELGSNEFPVPIDTLLIPLANGCKKYVKALFQD